MDQRFECIVVGNDMSSLVSAALLCASGKKTLLLSEGPLSGELERNGYVFNLDPFPWPGLAPGGLGETLLRQRGVSLPEIPREAERTLHQFILPEQRLDLFGDLRKTCFEFAREFPVQPDEIEAFFSLASEMAGRLEQYLSDPDFLRGGGGGRLWRDLIRYPGRRRDVMRLNGILADLGKRHPGLERIFRAQYLLFSGAPLRRDFPYSSGHAFTAPFRSGAFPPGAKQRIVGGLREICSAGDNACLAGCTVIRFRMKRRIEVDFSLEGDSWTVEGDRAVFSTKWEKLRPILVKGEDLTRLERKWKKVGHGGYPVTLHMGLKNRGIPELMGSSVLLLYEEKHRLMTDSLIYVEAGPGGGEGGGPEGGRALSATVFLDDSPWRLGDGELEEVFRVVFRGVECFLPFLRENLEFIDPAWSMDVSRKYQEVVNHKYAIRPPVLAPLPVFSRTPPDRIVLTGGLQYPELGFDGEILSGISSAAAITGG
ncbi:MAG TPA: hypothetical protein PLO86_03170 [Syntrophales bacterium]|nr:hypothetical protein [Syntrophales bacterium]HQB29739.1 hypothetical protein [Syntrophales bacterium]